MINLDLQKFLKLSDEYLNFLQKKSDYLLIPKASPHDTTADTLMYFSARKVWWSTSTTCIPKYQLMKNTKREMTLSLFNKYLEKFF